MTIRRTLLAATAVIARAGNGPAPVPAQGLGLGLGLGWLAELATIDARYQGYNIEMVEVTGGRFWAPYGGPASERYRQRPPIDLADPKLVAPAKALGSSLTRVSGTWANNTYLEAAGEHLRPRCGFLRSALATGPAELQSCR